MATLSGGARKGEDMTVEPERHPEQDRGDPVPYRVKLALSLIAAVLGLWFLYAWLVLDRHVLDAAGESVGTAFALGVLASVVAAVRSSR